MSYEVDDIDYEDLDDLALPDHIEWNNDETKEFLMDVLDLMYE